MKAAVTILTFIIVLVIVVIISLSAWLYLSGFFKYLRETGETTTKESLETLSSCIKIEEAFQNKFFIRNCGKGVITEDSLSAYVDDGLIDFDLDPVSIEEGKTGTIILSGVYSFSIGEHSLRIVNPKTEASIPFESLLPESCVLALDFDEDEGTTVYDKSMYNNNGNIIDVPCFYNKSSYGGHWYEYIGLGCDSIENSAIWNHVKNVCEQRGGDLVVIDSANENDFVKNLGSNARFINHFQDVDDLTDNSGIPEGCPGDEIVGCWQGSSYVNWAAGEPNNEGGGINDNRSNCGAMIWDGTIHDVWCGSIRDFVCEYTSDPGNFDESDKLVERIKEKFGKALKFDGVDDQLIIPDDPSIYLDGKNFTIAVQLKPIPQDLYRFVYYKWRPNLYLMPSGAWVFELDDGASKSVVISSPVQNKWFFAVQRVKQNIEHKAWLFNESGLVETDERNDIGTSTGSDGNDFQLSRNGWHGNNNAYYKGIIDSIRIYNKALNPEELIKFRII